VVGNVCHYLLLRVPLYRLLHYSTSSLPYATAFSFVRDIQVIAKLICLANSIYHDNAKDFDTDVSGVSKYIIKEIYVKGDR
jgi:hypothetical protein